MSGFRLQNEVSQIREIFQRCGFQLVCHAILCNVNSKSLSSVMPNPGSNWVGIPSVTKYLLNERRGWVDIVQSKYNVVQVRERENIKAAPNI